MKILITGSKGFIGRNLTAEMRSKGEHELFEYDIDTKEELLESYAKECEFVIHLAGINRPEDKSEFMKGNYGVTYKLLEALIKNDNKAPIIMASSVQAELDNEYGRSKRAAESLLESYSEQAGASVFIFRLCNIFGKWCRPHYNSVVATFCYNAANGLSFAISNPERTIRLAYIEDVIESFMKVMSGSKREKGYYSISNVKEVKLGELADLIRGFKNSRSALEVPLVSDPFIKNLYSTYLTYLPAEALHYPLKMNQDLRGSFTEMVKTPDRGQFSVNVIRPGITKGNHWHQRKYEKFIVVYGRALIQLRKIGDSEIHAFHMSGEEIQVVEIPPGFVHSIMNEGKTDLVTFMWCSECFDEEQSDTYFERMDDK